MSNVAVSVVCSKAGFAKCLADAPTPAPCLAHALTITSACWSVSTPAHGPCRSVARWGIGGSVLSGAEMVDALDHLRANFATERRVMDDMTEEVVDVRSLEAAAHAS